MDLRVDNGGLQINDSESGQSQDPIIVTSTADPASVLFDSNSSKINLINISDRGFTNGVLGLPQEPFAEWLVDSFLFCGSLQAVFLPPVHYSDVTAWMGRQYKVSRMSGRQNRIGP